MIHHLCYDLFYDLGYVDYFVDKDEQTVVVTASRWRRYVPHPILITLGMYMYGSICSTFRYICPVIRAPTLSTHSSLCASHVILNNNNVYHRSKIQNGSQTRQYQLENLSGV